MRKTTSKAHQRLIKVKAGERVAWNELWSMKPGMWCRRVPFQILKSCKLHYLLNRFSCSVLGVWILGLSMCGNPVEFCNLKCLRFEVGSSNVL
jgi:hypothetical protein